MALLQIDGLSKTFLLHRVNRRVQGCQDIDFAIEPGQFVGITGRSGSGKSTILRCIWRTNLPERGRILYDSQRFGMLDLAQATQRQMLYLRAYELGYVSQFLNALPRQTAYDIVLKSALEAYGADERPRAEEETERMLRHFDLDEGLWELYPRTFSGGEKLRLNIAAAMIKRPRLLLLDEATSALDMDTEHRLLENIMKSTRGKTCIVTTHRPSVLNMCTRVYRVSGQSVAQLSREELQRYVFEL